MNMWLFHTG